MRKKNIFRHEKKLAHRLKSCDTLLIGYSRFTLKPIKKKGRRKNYGSCKKTSSKKRS